MRIATTLMLGAAALICASAPLLAQEGFAPAVPAKTAKQALASTAKPVAAKPAEDAAPTTDDIAAPTADAPRDVNGDPVDAKPATTTATAEPAFEPAVQEAKNNDKAPAAADAAKHDPNDTDAIAAMVNDESISDYEVRQRVALYLATSGLLNQKLTEQQMTRIRGQILDTLEAEKVQLQEARKKKITVSPVEVDKRINGMMEENHFSITQLRTTLNAAGASEDALRAQITASIAWQKAVQDEYGDRVNVTPEMIDTEMARYADGASRTHYHVMEIFVPVDNPEQEAKVKKDVEEIVNQLHQNAPFPMVARQFSQHPTAASGGDMGWVHEGQLAPELNAALQKMEINAISAPIRSTGGYYVLGLRERQEGLGTKISTAPTGPVGPTGTLPLARLLFPVNPRAPKAELDQIMGVATQIGERYGDCETLEKMHDKMPGSVFMKLGDTKLADLSPQIQKALSTTHPGEAATPFSSEAGIELIARCDKKMVEKTAYVMPTRQQVEDQLFQNQISALARRYLRDLKRDSNIQVRDDSKPDALIR
jgi:peptidyl-prolyl cis-trans isomerase SurA